VIDATRTIELAARDSYGRLVALLASRSGDVAAAEDALSDAFVTAIERWPTDGIPHNPEGWLLAAARRRLIDGARHGAVRERAAPGIAYEIEAAGASSSTQAIDAALLEEAAFPDRRIELLFACAHPAIDATMHTPLMLQAVLGLDANVIASAFLSAPAAMAQRLVRAKRKIRDAGIRFEIPASDQFAGRLHAVMEAIYAAFGTGWDAIHGAEDGREALAEEALYLGRLVVDALPNQAEPRGLLALMLYCAARRHARRDANGGYVALSAQNPAQWNHAQIGEAESLLRTASRLNAPGRFQIEAAIQSAHLAPAFGRPADEIAIVALYDALLSYAPTVAALVNRAAAVGRAYGAVEGLAAAEAIPYDQVDDYQPWWALRSYLLARAGRVEESNAARERAVGLTEDSAVRDFLLLG